MASSQNGTMAFIQCARIIERGALRSHARHWTTQISSRKSFTKTPHTSQRYYSSPETTHIPPNKSKTPRRLLILGLALGITFYLTNSNSSSQATALNDTSFVPYTIISRTALSPSSFVLTVTPQTPNPNPPYLLPGTNRWRHPLWSVEFKQPEVQISRHYTPLPPSAAAADEEQQGHLRFYIRAIGDGEMSKYLHRLREGQDVFLRGPHVGFDLVKRLGACKHIVFLAGGTGVVPGMQAAKVALDGYEDTRVSLLWAVRKREEVQSAKPPGKPWWEVWGGREPAELDPALQGPSPVARQLAEMKNLYGDRLSVQIVVDEEKTAFQQHHIQKALTSISAGEATSSNPGTGCSLHDQRLHDMASEFEANSPECRCAPVDGSLSGKNLFIVSGPDGFVTHYAGPKLWRGGRQTQGPVEGIAAQIHKQNPQLARDWLVLKL